MSSEKIQPTDPTPENKNTPEMKRAEKLRSFVLEILGISPEEKLAAGQRKSATFKFGRAPKTGLVTITLEATTKDADPNRLVAAGDPNNYFVATVTGITQGEPHSREHMSFFLFDNKLRKHAGALVNNTILTGDGNWNETLAGGGKYEVDDIALETFLAGAKEQCKNSSRSS